MKKLTVSSYISLAAIVVSLVSMILYFVTASSAGYFRESYAGNSLALLIVSMVLIALVIASRFVSFKGMVGKAVDVVSSLVAALSSILLATSGMLYLFPKVEGLAFIFFSNADVAATIQTPENISSSKFVIVTFVVILVAGLIQAISCFFSGKKDQKAA